MRVLTHGEYSYDLEILKVAPIIEQLKASYNKGTGIRIKAAIITQGDR